MRRLAIALLLAIASLPLAGEAIASPPDIYLDDKGSLYIHGATAAAAGDRLYIRYVGVPYERRVRAGYCGEIRISPTQQFPDPGESFTIIETGQTFDSSTFPVSNDQECQGNQLVGGSGSWRDSRGRRYMVGGFRPGVRYTVRYNQSDRVRSAGVRCGFFRFYNSSRYPIPSQVEIDGITHTVASLPVAVAQRCQRIDGAYTRFTPVNW